MADGTSWSATVNTALQLAELPLTSKANTLMLFGPKSAQSN